LNKISKDFQSTQLTQSSKASQEIRKRRKMEIFIDSANIQEIKKWLDYGRVTVEHFITDAQKALIEMNKVKA